MLAELLKAEGERASELVTSEFRTAFNKDWIIRFFPKTEDRHNNSLIGVKRFAEIVENPNTFRNKIEKLDQCVEQKMEVKLRRGVRFVFARH